MESLQLTPLSNQLKITPYGLHIISRLLCWMNKCYVHIRSSPSLEFPVQQYFLIFFLPTCSHSLTSLEWLVLDVARDSQLGFREWKLLGTANVI